MGKQGTAPDSARRCRCGRRKPPARAVCYTCLPRRSRQPLLDLDAEYTLADRLAIARACDLSYSKVTAIMEHGGQPPLIRPVEWPEGSAHGKGVE